MRKPNSLSEIKQERDTALLSVFRRLISDGHNITVKALSRKMVATEAPRFWVSEERATIVISQMLRGAPTDGMSASKHRMYQEICTRVRRLLAERPRRSLTSAVREVIEAPAPEFYVSPRYAMDVIRDVRRRVSPSHRPRS